MTKPYMGKILWVDLDDHKVWDEEIPDEVYQQVLSGMGLAAKVLFREIPRGANPLGPDNVLGLVSGLLTGTGAQMTGRWLATGKSPLTGGWGDANAGGQFSPTIKRAGYDGIFVKGVSDKPVYLVVNNGEAEIKDASHIWGMDTVETEERLEADLGLKNAKVACIGPAGERLSCISGIVTDKGRIAARSGLGAVMGSKKLKAVVCAGTNKPGVHDPQRMKTLNREFVEYVKEHQDTSRRPLLSRLLSRLPRFAHWTMRTPGWMIVSPLVSYGTPMCTVTSAESGDSPVKNWKGWASQDFPLSTHSRRLGPGLVVENQKRRYHCHSCPIGCGGILELSGKTRFNLTEVHKPEYETLSAFGSLILNNDLEAIFMINDMLNRAGMDTIAAGSAVAFAMECYEKGVLTQADTDELDLTWGNSEAVLELVQKMIKREGIGDLLADGSRKAAHKLDSRAREFHMNAGGQDLPMHDPRLDPGLAVSYTMEPSPGKHTNYSYTSFELYELHRIFKGLPTANTLYRKASRLKTEDREILLSVASKFMQIVNGAGSCLFAVQTGPDYPLIKYLEAATGWKLHPWDYLMIGERIQHIRQSFNIKHGRVPSRDFKLPDRVVGEPPMEGGPLKGTRIPIEQLDKDFAAAMGWDQTGMPLLNRLRELGLSDVADDLVTG